MATYPIDESGVGYRPCVGIMLLNYDGSYVDGKRRLYYLDHMSA